MAKLLWKIDVEGENHEIALDYAMLFGKAIIKIDGDSFNISTGLFRLRGTSQIFRLGESQARQLLRQKRYWVYPFWEN